MILTGRIDSALIKVEHMQWKTVAKIFLNLKKYL